MKRAILIIFIIFLLMQFIRPEKVEFINDAKFELQADEYVMDVFKRACYDCHSNNINYPWYSQIAPFSWIVANHTKEGIKALNFSVWYKYSEKEREQKLKDIYRTIYASMPLQTYLMAHKEAELTKAEREKIRDWTGVRK